MFFTLSFQIFPSTSIRVIIGTDGRAYFHATDTAKLILQQNPSQFVLRNATLRIKDIMSKDLGLKGSILKVWLFEWEEGIAIMKTCYRTATPRIVGKMLTSEMTRIRPVDNDTESDLQFENLRPASSVVVKVIPKSEDQPCEFLVDFMRCFESTCLEFYDARVRKIHRDSAVLNIEQPGLDRYGLTEPPKRIRVTYGDGEGEENIFIYNLA